MVTTAVAVMALAAAAVSTPAHDWKMSGPWGGTATTIAIDAKHPNILLSGGRSSLLYQTQDSAQNWQLLNLPQRNLGEVTSILIDPADSDHYLVGMLAAYDPGVFESHDQGKTWTAIKDLRGIGVRALTAAASKPSRFVAGTLEGVMLSDDSGKTWTRISDPNNPEMQGITAVAVDTSDPNIIYAGTQHLPWRTTDGGKTWESIHKGMIDDSDVFSIYVDPAAPNDVFASACSGVYSTNDRGDDWHKLLGIPNTSRRTHVIRQDPVQKDTIYAGTTLGLFKSVNAGKTWRTLNNTQVNALVFDPSQPKTMYLAMEYDGLGKSDSSGESIRLVNDGFADRGVSAITTAGDRFFALSTGDLFVSADRGASWSAMPRPRSLEGVRLSSITGVPSKPRSLIAASEHAIYRSTDGGVVWRPLAIRVVETPKPQPEKKTAPRASARTTRTRQTARRRPLKPREIVREISPSEISGVWAVQNSGKDLVFAATNLGLLRSTDAAERWTFVEVPGSTAIDMLYLPPVANGNMVLRAPGGLFFSKDFGEHWTGLPFPLPASDINGIAVPVDPSAPLLVATTVGLYSSTDNGANWSKNPHGLPSATVAAVLYGHSDRKMAYAVEYGQLYQSNDAGQSWSHVPTSLPSLHLWRLWLPDPDSTRLFGLTTDIGILFRD